jgi:hypothetical protein
MSASYATGEPAAVPLRRPRPTHLKTDHEREEER